MWRRSVEELILRLLSTEKLHCVDYFEQFWRHLLLMNTSVVPILTRVSIMLHGKKERKSWIFIEFYRNSSGVELNLKIRGLVEQLC